MPVASDDVQSNYSVPFPYAEQGSVYAVAEIDGNASASLVARDMCTPGKVVTAELSAERSAPLVTQAKEMIPWNIAQLVREVPARLADWLFS